MNKFESASILAGISPNEEPQVSEPTNLHVITGEVVANSENGTVLVSMDGLVFSEDDTQYIEMDTIGGLEEGDEATIILAGEAGSSMTPLAIGSTGSVDRLSARVIETELLIADKADIEDLEAATARIGDLEADHVSVSDFSAEQANIDNLQAVTADIDTIRANSAKVQNLTAAQLEADHAKVGQLDVNQIAADHATIGTLDTTYMHANMSNSDVAWIQNGTIKDGAITNAMINSVSANKLTAGTIDASNITVTNLNADNIMTGTINGQRIGTGSLSLDKLSENVYTEAEVDTIVDGLNDRIDGAIETHTGTAVPTLNNSPASSWNTTALKDEHVGDVYYVVNSQSQQNGYCYRFTKSGSTYSWQLIKDSDVTAALSRLTTAEGKITSIESFDSTVSSFMTNTDSELTSVKSRATSLETRMTDAEGDISEKVDTSTFNTLSQTVDGNSASITSMSTVLSNNGLTSSTNITNTVNTVSQTASGNSSKISQLTTTLGTNADGTTKAGDVVHRTSAIEQDVSSFKTTVSETYTTKEEFGNLEIGGRNWLLDTGTFNDWYRSSAVTASDGITTFPSRSSLSWICTRHLTIPAADFFGNTWTFSFDYRSDDFSSTSGNRYIDVSIDAGATYNASSRTKYGRLYVNTWVPTTEWQRGSVSFTPADESFLDKGSGDVNYVGITIWSHTLNSFQVRRMKLEKGNAATDWTPAPEDIETRVSSAESSITQNANNIALKVSESDVTGNYVVGKINLNSTTATIAAQHINLQGAVTISDLASDASTALADAAETATSYVTDITGGGIMVHPSTDDDTGVRITSDVDIRQGNVSIANFGALDSSNNPTARVGKVDDYHVAVDTDSLDVMDGTTTLASFGSEVLIGPTNDNHIEIGTMTNGSKGLALCNQDAYELEITPREFFSPWSSTPFTFLMQGGNQSLDFANSGVEIWALGDPVESNYAKAVLKLNARIGTANQVGSFTLQTNAGSNTWSTPAGTVLWSGGWHMTAGHTANLTYNVSTCPTGIVLHFQPYTSSTVQNYNHIYHFVPKTHVASYNGAGIVVHLGNPGFINMATKYLYISNDHITGHADNNTTGTNSGITYNNAAWVMTQVIAV